MNFDFKRLFEKRPTLYYTESTDISRKRWSEQMDMENLIGETTEYDKKAALEVKKPKSWCKSVSAFANTLGGALIFGMADDGQIVGLTEPDSDAEKISELIKTRMEPIPEFRLRFHKTDDGKVLLILDVFKGEETPYYYSGDGTLEAFVRIGNESVRASATEAETPCSARQKHLLRLSDDALQGWRTTPFPSCGSAIRSGRETALTTKTLFPSGWQTRAAF